MHAFLITGSTQTKRKEEVNHVLDTYKIPLYRRRSIDVRDEKESIGIDDIKQFIASLWIQQPGNALKAGIINSANSLTEQAQNALLKTLEEPPESTILILETGKPDSLIETVRSRCQIQNLSQSSVDNDIQNNSEFLAKLLAPHTTVAECFAEMEKEIGSRDEAKTWLQNAITFTSYDKQENVNGTNVYVFKRMCFEVHCALEANVSYKNALGHLIISIKTPMLDITSKNLVQ